MTTPPDRPRPGTAEAVVSWLLWALVSATACVVAFASIFPLAFRGAVPEQADAAAAVFVWSLLTVFACVAAPIAMGIGHWRHWHIWYWPTLCVSVLVRTLLLLHNL